MTTVNRGVALLNNQPLQDDDTAVFCVLGTGGGGTTMTSRLLEAAGVFMGENMAFNAEDLEFAGVLRSPSPDASRFRALIASRNAEHRRWGFKSPLKHHWSLLSNVENIRYVAIFRDIVAVGMRSEMESPERLPKAMAPILSLQKSILDSIASTRRPLLLISYEKALVSPDVISRHMLKFCGSTESDHLLAELRSIIQPNEPHYVSGHHLLRQQLARRQPAPQRRSWLRFGSPVAKSPEVPKPVPSAQVSSSEELSPPLSEGQPAPPAPPLPGTHSSRRINALAMQMRASTYLEIGVARGRTFLAVEIDHKAAVDPRFAFDWKPHQTDRVKFYPVESDTYFKEHKGRFDVVMLDGLHVFEQTFRDFCNALIVTHDKSIIVIDDTVPTDIYSAWPDANEAIAMRKEAGGSGAAWHGDIFKMVYVIHDFFPMLSYCTINTEGNPQTLVWREQRDDFRPRFNSLETISRMSWFDMRKNMDLLNLLPEGQALTLLAEKLAA